MMPHWQMQKYNPSLYMIYALLSEKYTASNGGKFSWHQSGNNWFFSPEVAESLVWVDLSIHGSRAEFISPFNNHTIRKPFDQINQTAVRNERSIWGIYRYHGHILQQKTPWTHTILPVMSFPVFKILNFCVLIPLFALFTAENLWLANLISLSLWVSSAIKIW